MKRQWLYLGILFLFGTGLVLAACGAEAPSMSLVAAGDSAAVAAPAKKQPAAPYTIALVMKTLTNPFFVQMEKGARKAKQDLGVKLIVKTGAQETSIE